jgi:hypothetical protein
MEARPRLADLLLGVVLVGVLAGALAVLLAGGGPATEVAEVVALVLVPAGVLAGGLLGVRAARRAVVRRGERTALEATNTPIELVAADLRRLLRQHDLALRSLVPVSAKHLWALELAITRRATQAAQALEVPHPAPPAYRGLDAPQLGHLLRALAAEGVVLPRTAGLMGSDGGR